MSIVIGSYEFVGPSLKPEDVLDKSGVYAVLKERGTDFELIDLGFDVSVKAVWERFESANLLLAALYVDDPLNADSILRELETEYGPCEN